MWPVTVLFSWRTPGTPDVEFRSFSCFYILTTTKKEDDIFKTFFPFTKKKKKKDKNPGFSDISMR